MCQCGCGDYAGRWRLPGPDGKWYVISPYQGCRDCDNPAGLSIDLFDEEDMRFWDAKRLPVIGGPEHPYSGIPMIDMGAFEKSLFAVLDENGVSFGTDEDEADDAREEVRTSLWGLVGGVVYDTAAIFDKEIRKAQREEKRRRKAEKEAAKGPLLTQSESNP